MSYIWFQNVLESLGKRLNYESISNLYGNSFAKDATKIIQSANPLVKPSTKGSALTLLSMPSKMAIIDGPIETQKAQGEKAMGDMSWFEEYIS